MDLRILPSCVLVLAIASCGGQPVITIDAAEDYIGNDSGPDAGADVLHPDSVVETFVDLGNDDTNVTETGFPDAGDDCQGTLKSWMCSSGGCGGDNYCSGYIASCNEPPCWGAYCDFMPGNCMPGIQGGSAGGICKMKSDCPAGWSCLADMFNGRGLCRELPAAGFCWNDQDCGDQRTCAGEVICHVGNQCNGPEHPGVCMDNPPPDTCLDDSMCRGGWCSGAVFCAPGAAGCTPAEGTCVDGTPPACEPLDGGEAACGGSEWGSWCVGRLTVSQQWCAPPPASAEAEGQCWEDADCTPTDGILCRSATTCPPRSFCRVSGSHSGICGPAPKTGEGLLLEFAGQGSGSSMVLGTAPMAILLNRGPVPVYVNQCGTVAVEAQKNGQWLENGVFLDFSFSASECTALPVADPPLVRIAPGSGRVLMLSPDTTVNEDLANRTIRLQLRYYLGCIPGGKMSDGMECVDEQNGLARVMTGAPIFWSTSAK